MRTSIAIALSGLIALSGCNLAVTPSQKLEKKAKDAVAFNMKDPASSVFRSLDVYPGSGVVCGEVNSKNSFGAMAGFDGFVYDNGHVTMADSGDLEFSRARLRCADASLDEIDPEGALKRATQRAEAEFERTMAKIPEGPEKDELRRKYGKVDASGEK